MKARLTVVEQICFQPQDEQPQATSHSFCSWMKTDEQPYLRQVKVGPQWQSLDCGWIEKASTLRLINDAGKDVRVNLSKEQQAELDTKVIEVSFSGETGNRIAADAFLPPKESLRLRPVDVKRVLLRCPTGECKLTIHLYPE